MTVRRASSFRDHASITALLRTRCPDHRHGADSVASPTHRSDSVASPTHRSDSVASPTHRSDSVASPVHVADAIALAR